MTTVEDICRIREERDDYKRFFNGCMNGLILSALIYVPLLCWYFSTRRK